MELDYEELKKCALVVEEGFGITRHDVLGIKAGLIMRLSAWIENDRLKGIPTCDLVDELSNREGVEKIMQGPEGNDHIICTDIGAPKYDMNRGGPCIILRIID